MIFKHHHEHYYHLDDADAARLVARLVAAFAPLFTALDRRMSQLNDDLNASLDHAEEALAEARSRVLADVADLKQTILDLQGQLGEPGLTADEANAIKARIESLTSSLRPIDPTSPETLPTDPDAPQVNPLRR